MPRIVRSLLPFVLLLAAGGCTPAVLFPTGYVAAQQRDILVIATVLMLIIIIPVMILIALYAWKYRAENKSAEYRPEWHHSTSLELLIWAAPLLIIICLGAVTWVGTHLLDPYRPLERISADEEVPEGQEPLVIQVVALDWKWLFIYPEQGVATVNDLPLPVDRPVRFDLTSSTVMNAFYIPDFAGMIYAMPGMETKLHGVMNEVGEFRGMASHYSGAGFPGMRFWTRVMEDGDFDAWVAETRDSEDVLDTTRYLELEEPSEFVDPMTFGSFEDGLYARIVEMCVPEGSTCMSELHNMTDGEHGHAGHDEATATNAHGASDL